MRTWLITGASSGLGRMMTERLLARGDRVAATVRRPDALAELRATHGERLRTVLIDLTDTNAVRREVDAAFDAFGRIDVVVGNAGYALFGAVEEASDAQIERQIATNLTGSIQFLRASLPHLRRQGGGRVLQVSSEGGQVTYPSFGLYHATKWGIEGLVETLAQEVAPFGIRCVIVEPGPTGTGFGANLDHAEPIAAYDATPAGDVRRRMRSGTFELKGDAGRTVDAILHVAEQADPPLRLALGSTSFENIERELLRRLASLRAQKDVAYGADR